MACIVSLHLCSCSSSSLLGGLCVLHPLWTLVPCAHTSLWRTATQACLQGVHSLIVSQGGQRAMPASPATAAGMLYGSTHVPGGPVAVSDPTAATEAGSEPVSSPEHGSQHSNQSPSAKGKKRSRPSRPRWTHFLSVPLNGRDERAAFERLQARILEHHSATISEKHFINAAKWHLTLCMLALPDAEATDKARNALAAAHPDFVRVCTQHDCLTDAGMRIPLQTGLHGFEDRDVTKARVLFCKPVEGPAAAALTQIAADAISALQAVDIQTSPLSELQLHATAINVKYAAKGRRKRPKPIDATEMLASLQDWPAMTCQVPALHLSMLSQRAENGYYKCEQSLPLTK